MESLIPTSPPDKPRRPRDPDLDGLYRISEELRIWAQRHAAADLDIPADLVSAQLRLRSAWLQLSGPVAGRVAAALAEYAPPTLLQQDRRGA